MLITERLVGRLVMEFPDEVFAVNHLFLFEILYTIPVLLLNLSQVKKVISSPI